MRRCFVFLATLIMGVLVFNYGVALSVSKELAEEQVFRWGCDTTDIDTVDPAFSTGSSSYNLGPIIFNGLVRLPLGTINFENLEGDLAESWEISKDGLVYKFHLRKGVQWHRGYGEFTAEDVKYTFDRLKNAKSGSPFGAKYLEIKEVKVLDRYNVEIVLRKPNPFFLMDQVLSHQAGFIVCKKQGEERPIGNLGIEVVGTGPFKVDKYIPKEMLIIARNENYFRGSPTLERVEYHFMKDIASRTMAFLKGEVDGIEGYRDRKWVTDLKKNSGLILDVIPMGSGCAFHFNMTKKPLDNVKVRKALAYAIEREKIHQYFGDVWTEMTAPVPSAYFGALQKEDIPEDLLYNYDLEKAKKLLADAGYPGGGFTLNAFTTPRPHYIAVFEIIAEMWKALGVELKITVVDHTTFHHNIRADMNDVLPYTAARPPFADSYLTQFYYSKSIVGKPHAITNFSHYGDVDADGDGLIDNADWLIEQARSEINPEKQKLLYGLAQLQILEDMPAKPLHEVLTILGRKNYVDLGIEIKGALMQIYPLEKARILKH